MQSGLLVFTDFLGIVAFALAGILAAENKRVDPVGVFIMAFTTAFGGGIMRDLIIGNRPMYWIAHQEYVWATLIMTMFAPCIIKYFQEKVLRQLFVWSDAIGLGFFAAGGTSLSITFGLPDLPSVLLGVCTGVFGGLLRDVFLNRIPMVMSDRQPYAFSAFLGSWLYVALRVLECPEFVSLFASTFFIVGLRMFCWYRKLEFVRYGSGMGDDRIFSKIRRQPAKPQPSEHEDVA